LDYVGRIHYSYAMDTIVIWDGTLAILLNRFMRSLYKVEKVMFSEKEQFK